LKEECDHLLRDKGDFVSLMRKW